MTRRSPGLAAAFAFLLLLPDAAGGLDPEPGFQVAALQVAPAGAILGGMDVLPNGHVALFDGQALVEVDPQTGNVVRTLWTPPAAVFGSFVRTDPTGTFVVVGESTNHEIRKVPLDGSPDTLVAVVPWNFSADFLAPDLLFVAHGDSSWQATTIEALDLKTGTLDAIARVPGPSGPVLLTPSGDLLYGWNSPQFPAPPGQQGILRFPAEKVLAALGPGELTEADALPFASGLTAPSALAIDREGDVYVSDAIDGVLLLLRPNGLLERVVGRETGVFPSVGALALRPSAAPGAYPFDPFAPASDETLFALSTDFFATNDLNAVRPARCVLATNPPPPLAPGAPFQIEVDGGPPGGAALLFAAAAPITETPLWFGGRLVPFGLEPATLLFLGPLILDAQGRAALPAVAPAGLGVTISLQTLVQDGSGASGSSPVFDLRLP